MRETSMNTGDSRLHKTTAGLRDESITSPTAIVKQQHVPRRTKNFFLKTGKDRCTIAIGSRRELESIATVEEIT